MTCNPTNHIDECPHAFIKNGVVEHIFVFKEENHNSPMFDAIHADHGTDTVVCLCSASVGVVPHRWSTWDGNNFTPPTVDYLYSIGVSNMNQVMLDELTAKLMAEDAAREEAAATASTEPTAPTA